MGQLRNLSVVVCSKSDQEGLIRTLSSIQTIGNELLEVIIVLSDYDELAIKQMEKNFQSLSFKLIQTPPEGVFKAQNIGLRAVSKTFVMFMNGGDEISNPSGLKNLLAAMENAMWGYGRLNIVGTGTNNRTYKFGYLRVMHRLGLKFVPHPSTVVNTSYAKQLGGFDESYTSAADHKMLLEYSKKSKPVVRNEIISTFYLGGISSRQQKEIVKDSMKISQEIFGYFLKNKYLDSVIWKCVYMIRKILKN